MIKFDIVTIFPNQITSFISEGVFRIAKEKDLVEIKVHNLRNWTNDNHKTVDDTPFGGGAGMILKPEPIFKAVEELKTKNSIVVLTTPRGEKLTQPLLKKLSVESAHYIIVCGHYEGFDERIHEELANLEISIGDFVLSGGEIPALVIVDGIIRLIPGVLGNESSLLEESFEDGLEYPQYTRPADFNGLKVPEILLSGHHENIKKWRSQKSLDITKNRRPDIAK